MKPASVLILFLALPSSHTFAQDNPSASVNSHGVAQMEQIAPDGSSTPATSFNPAATLHNGCPVALTAQHLSDGDLVRTGITHPKGIGQGLHLTFYCSATGIISEATVLVRGWTPKGRITQAAPESQPNIARRMHIHLKPDSAQSAVADIWVSGLSAITSVEILSATLADGSLWTRSGILSCRVAPDLLMPVHP